VRRSAPLRRGKGLERGAALRRTGPPRRRTPLRRSAVSPASPEQRAKVAGRACLVCGMRPVDPAHLVPRSLGGCDQPDCVVPLCRPCHRAYDQGQLDLVPWLEPRFRTELAHALLHVGLFRLLRRVTGTRWAPVDADDAPSAA
jgi:5-methylcytosine-specific restriction endonuclease McrA